MFKNKKEKTDLTNYAPSAILQPIPEPGNKFFVVYLEMYAPFANTSEKEEEIEIVSIIGQRQDDDGKTLWIVETKDRCHHEIAYEVSKQRWREWDGTF